MYGDYTRKDQIKDVFNAVAEGRVPELAYYLDDGCGEDLRDEDGRTLLVQAVVSKQAEAARLLLSRGANPDLPSFDTGRVALHFAAATGDVQMIEALLDYQAMTDYTDEFDWTPLHMATARGKLEAVKALVEAGANLEARDRQNDRPIELAELRGSHSLETINKPFPPIIRYLKEAMSGYSETVREELRQAGIEDDIRALKSHNPERYRLKP